MGQPATASATSPAATEQHRDATVPIAATLVLLCLGLGAIAAGLAVLSAPDADMVANVLLGAGMALIVGAILPLVFGIVRRRWHLTDVTVEVEAAPWFLPVRLGRTRRLPLARLIRVETYRLGARPVLRLVPDRGRPWTLMADANMPFVRTLLTRAAAAAGRAVPVVPGGHLFTTLPGLALIALCLVVATGIAGTVLWVLWEGGLDDGPSRSGQGIAFALALPFLAGWWLLASLRQRRAWRRATAQGIAS